jgi:hypothetical protein
MPGMMRRGLHKIQKSDQKKVTPRAVKEFLNPEKASSNIKCFFSARLMKKAANPSSTAPDMMNMGVKEKKRNISEHAGSRIDQLHKKDRACRSPPIMIKKHTCFVSDFVRIHYHHRFSSFMAANSYAIVAFVIIEINNFFVYFFPKSSILTSSSVPL